MSALRRPVARLLLGSALCWAVACGRIGFEWERAATGPRVGGDAASEDAGTGGAGGRSAGGGISNAGGTPAESGGSAARPPGNGGGAASGGRAAGNGGTASGGAPAADSGASGGNGDGGMLVDGGEPEASVEAGSPYPGCVVSKQWDLAFDSDPAQADGNLDSVPDWVVRGGGAFPATELASGVWSSTTSVPLDSNPHDDFATRVLVDVRLRSTSVPAAPHRGGIFWINLNDELGPMAAVFLSVGLTASGTQDFTLVGKTDANTEVELTTVAGLPDAFLDVHLDLDATANTAHVFINRVDRGTFVFPVSGTPNGDAFATLIAWDGTAAFASTKVRRCEP